MLRPEVAASGDELAGVGVLMLLSCEGMLSGEETLTGEVDGRTDSSTVLAGLGCSVVVLMGSGTAPKVVRCWGKPGSEQSWSW